MTLDAITGCNGKRFLRTLTCILVFGVIVLSELAGAQTANTPANDSKADSKNIPTIDGGLGPCTADFTVNDSNNSPVYAATIKVHIAYGFMNVRKLDLQIGTNAEGKARFTGIPNRINHGLYFYASEDDRTAQYFLDPSSTCKAEYTFALQKKSQ